ncbi:putative DNA repair glycosylase MJ1434 [Desulfovibrionales bacterium]
MNSDLLLRMYKAMLVALGPSGWWPGETPFEVVVGALLTQNTSWVGVSRAIVAIRKRGLLTPHGLAALPEPELAELIRPTGYFRLKASRLGHVLRYLKASCDFDLNRLADYGRTTHGLAALRLELLSVNGIGPETADSILCYALDLPSFVVDAYTRRILHRHGLALENTNYKELQDDCMAALPKDVQLYNECHALIVRTAKTWCHKRTPRCDSCPLQPFLKS